MSWKGTGPETRSPLLSWSPVSGLVYEERQVHCGRARPSVVVWDYPEMLEKLLIFWEPQFPYLL